MNFYRKCCLYSMLFISACSFLSPLSVEENIRNRVKLRWDGLVERNWSDAYRFETAGYRKSHSLKQFKAQFGQSVTWEKVTVPKIEVGNSKATVTVKLPFTMVLPNQGVQKSEATLTEIWLLDEGEWSHYTK